ncbi:hypothetical protein SBOR_2165 [Sclerotinia borealis F-4128]|uniref:Oxidoreductase-like domain-containing protein n=1 Tax=Sclerotinia borealis (strain F-4128) TaxID=1432307 RepID=W9CNQ7_SCLBF|nr:hypothetical protein SBOR_2165 [Sclerotinia borealis F-4128]
MEHRTLLRLSQRLKLPPSVRYIPSFARHESTSNKPVPSTRQAHPQGDYYALLLSSSSSPSPKSSSAPPTTASSSNPPITASTSPEPSPDPAILFTSRLSSPLERRTEILRQSQPISQIHVPPRPEEPDNCCMSGCVNCVWDSYRDEVEEWAAAKKEADRALRQERKKRDMRGAAEAATSVDDDGKENGDDLFEGVPVGIRAFMEQEKRLKEKHQREGTVG